MCTSQFSCCNVMLPAGNCRISCPSTSNNSDTFDCECLPGFTGGDCDVDIDDCISDPCSNNGNCSDGVNGFSCDCGAGYTGETCSTPIEQQCNIVCENGGTCVLTADVASCRCLNGYTGNLCQGTMYN